MKVQVRIQLTIPDDFTIDEAFEVADQLLVALLPEVQDPSTDASGESGLLGVDMVIDTENVMTAGPDAFALLSAALDSIGQRGPQTRRTFGHEDLVAQATSTEHRVLEPA